MGLIQEGRPILNLGFHSMGWECGLSKKEREIRSNSSIQTLRFLSIDAARLLPHAPAMVPSLSRWTVPLNCKPKYTGSQKLHS